MRSDVAILKSSLLFRLRRIFVLHSFIPRCMPFRRGIFAAAACSLDSASHSSLVSLPYTLLLPLKFLRFSVVRLEPELMQSFPDSELRSPIFLCCQMPL